MSSCSSGSTSAVRTVPVALGAVVDGDEIPALFPVLVLAFCALERLTAALPKFERVIDPFESRSRERVGASGKPGAVQLALEAGFRALNMGELVGELVRATLKNNLVRQVLDPRAERRDPVRQPTASQRERKSRAGKA